MPSVQPADRQQIASRRPPHGLARTRLTYRPGHLLRLKLARIERLQSGTEPVWR